MDGKISAGVKRVFCVSLFLFVGFVSRLPRASEALSLGNNSGHISPMRAETLHALPHDSGPGPMDMRLFKIRKFRRRRINPILGMHLSSAYLAAFRKPSSFLLLSSDNLFLSREPDSLIHPPT